MREIFTEIFENQPLDPTEAARRGARPRLRKRFYQRAAVGEPTEQGFPVLLDGKPVYTPARRALAAPARELAEAIAAEWNAQGEEIDPARMPLTRLANAVIDAVAEKPAEVAAEIEQYLGSDLVFYRAETPEGLIARQAQHWDPVLAWARDQLGARFMLGEGVVHVRQPEEAIAAARAAIPSEPWRLGRAVLDHLADRLGAFGARAGRRRARGRGGLGRRPCRRGLADAAMGQRRALACPPRIPFRRDAGGG